MKSKMGFAAFVLYISSEANPLADTEVYRDRFNKKAEKSLRLFKCYSRQRFESFSFAALICTSYRIARVALNIRVATLIQCVVYFLLYPG